MEAVSLVPLVLAGSYFILLLVIAFQRPLHKPHVLFMIYLLSAILWSSSVVVLRSNFFLDYKLLLFKFVICASLWWVVQLYCFVRSFLGLPLGLGAKFGYGSLAILVTLAALGYAPPSVTFINGMISPAYGWWFLAYVLPLLILAFMGMRSLVKMLRTTTSLAARNTVFYLIIAVIVLIIFCFSGISPLAKDFPLSHLGGLISACILTYAVVQHELISISYILRRVLGLATFATMAIGAYLCVFFIFHWLIGLKLQSVTIVVAGMSALIVSPPAYFLRNLYLGKIEQLFYKEKHRYRKELHDFVKNGLSGIFNLEELSSGILPPLVKALNCRRAYMLLPVLDDFSVSFSEPHAEDNPSLRLSKKSPIVAWLKREHLTREDIDIRSEFRGIWNKEIEGIKNLGIELLFPLVSRGNLIGILAVGQKYSGKYSLEDVNLVESISDQVAVSLEKEYLQEELRKQGKELTLINELSAIIASSLKTQDVYDVFVAGLREVIEVDFATVVLIEDNKLCFSALASNVGSIWKVGQQVNIKGTAAEWVVKHKRSLVELDLKRDRMFATGQKYLEAGIRSIVYLPLMTKGEVIGSLVIASCRPKAYSKEQVRLLERLASQISTSVANSQLYAKAEQRARVDELTGLFNRRHFDEAIKLEIERHSRYANHLCLIFLDLDNFKKYNDNLGHAAGDNVLIKASRAIKGAIRNVDIASRYGGDEFAIIMPHTSDKSSRLIAERICETLLTKMQADGIQVSASLGLASWPNDGLTADSIISAADQALYHAKRTGGNRVCLVSEMLPLSTEISEVVSSDEKEILSVIYALAATIEAKDHYTYGHSQKVRQYAVALSEAIGQPSSKVAIVSHAALLHDIGKIGIYDEILNKPGKLDKDEHKLIREHSQLSKTIVQNVRTLTPCLPAILHHH